MNINVLYEDNHLLIVDKPVNIPVQEDSSEDKDLLTMLKEYIKEKYNKPGDVYLGLVHRLDRPVGGAVVFAKTSKAAARLSNEVRLQNFDRHYHAVVENHLEQKKGTLTNHLFKDHAKNISKVVHKNHRDSKMAKLDYEMVSEIPRYSLLKIKLHTGRSHQIRVQLSHFGHPLFGDQKYNKGAKVGQQIALYSTYLRIKHPTKDEYVEVFCKPPETFPWSDFNVPD